MNIAEYTSSWQSAAGADKECQYLNQLYEDLKVTFLTEGSTFKIPFFGILPLLAFIHAKNV